MESELILRLSLLRRLCPKTPRLSYLAKIINRTAQTQRSSRNSSLNTSRQLFFKYPSSQRELNFVKGKSQSLDAKANVQKTSRENLQDYGNLSGWNVQNEEENEYSKLLQKKNSSICAQEMPKCKKMPKKRMRFEKQKKFTYCEEDINYFFKESNIFETKKSVSRNHRSKKLKPLIIDESKTQENELDHKYFPCNGKENLLAEQLALICPSATPKAHHPGVNLWPRGGISVQMNRKRLC